MTRLHHQGQDCSTRPRGSREAEVPQAHSGQLQRGRSRSGGLGLHPLPSDPGPGVAEGAGWGLDGQTQGPWAPASAQRLLKCHPGLTKKRVELVPWSTAPTNGPKTAFFAAAMKPASGQPAIAARFPGDGGGRGEGQAASREGEAACDGRTLGPRSRQPLYPRGTFSPRPSDPGPAPKRVPHDSGGVAGGGRCLPGQPISERRKRRNVPTIRER